MQPAVSAQPDWLTVYSSRHPQGKFFDSVGRRSGWSMPGPKTRSSASRSVPNRVDSQRRAAGSSTNCPNDGTQNPPGTIALATATPAVRPSPLTPCCSASAASHRPHGALGAQALISWAWPSGSMRSAAEWLNPPREHHRRHSQQPCFLPGGPRRLPKRTGLRLPRMARSHGQDLK